MPRTMRRLTIADLIGARITRALQVDVIYDKIPAFEVTADDGTVHTVLVYSDPEGNGPGNLDITRGKMA